MNYRIDPDGSWSLESEKIQIERIRPFVDGLPAEILAVSCGEDRIDYKLAGADLSVCLSEEEGDVLVSTRLSMGEEEAPFESVEPIGRALLRGAERVFCQGFGMEGPSGLYEAKEGVPDSNGLIALTAQGSILTGSTADHSRFLNRWRFEKEKPLFGEERALLTGSFDLEKTVSKAVSLPVIRFHETRVPGEKAGAALNEALSRCARETARQMGARTHAPFIYHWNSWYYLYQNVSMDCLREYLPAFSKAGFSDFRYIQIDAGYAPHPGDWLSPCPNFPNGLAEASELIRSYGYESGVWIAPFIVGDKSRLFREHPDWVLNDLSGRPLSMIQSYNEPKVWGLSDSDYYVLDCSQPEAFAYLRTVFKTLKSYGFTLFKTDFLLWSMAEPAGVRRYDPSMTRVELLRRTFEMIREEIGEESYLLGCIAPFLPLVGIVDGMRIAGDVGACWKGDYGPLNMLRELPADNYFNGIYWQNDPDSVMLRDFETSLTGTEIRSLALLQAVSTGAVTTSEPVHLIGEERKKLLRFIRPDRHYRAEFLRSEAGELVLSCRLDPERALILILNSSDEERTILLEQTLFDWAGDWFLIRDPDLDPAPVWRRAGDLVSRLKPHACSLYFLCAKERSGPFESLWVW